MSWTSAATDSVTHLYRKDTASLPLAEGAGELCSQIFYKSLACYLFRKLTATVIGNDSPQFRNGDVDVVDGKEIE